MRRQIKDTLLFLGFCLLAGFLHSNDPDPAYFLTSAFYCAEYLIYAGLVIFWAQSVRQRLLPTRAKGYLLASACLMLLFIAAQFTKYRVSVTPGMARRNSTTLLSFWIVVSRLSPVVIPLLQ